VRILVRSLLPLGKGKVLDPFSGSGSTIAACKAIGYDSIGIEIDDLYFSSLENNINELASLYPKFKGESLEADLAIDAPKRRCREEPEKDLLYGISDDT